MGLFDVYHMALKQVYTTLNFYGHIGIFFHDIRSILEITFFELKGIFQFLIIFHLFSITFSSTFIHLHVLFSLQSSRLNASLLLLATSRLHTSNVGVSIPTFSLPLWIQFNFMSKVVHFV